MENRYRLILSNNNFYREVQLPSAASQYRVGTTYESDCRFAKERFFTEFELLFSNDGTTWTVSCRKGDIFFQDKGTMKLKSYKLSHGTELQVLYQYQGDDQILFKLSFILDFEAEKTNYERVLDVGGMQLVTFGRDRNCDIVLDDQLLGHDTVKLERRGNGLYIVDSGTRYGVYVNGVKIQGEEEIRDYDFFSILGFSFYYKEGELYTSKHTKLFPGSVPVREIAEQDNHLAYPQFNRNTQVKITIPTDDITVLDPPAKPEKPKQNIVMTLLPSLAMIALVVVMRGVMGGGNMSFILYSAASMGLGVITTIIGFITGNKEFKENTNKREEEYSKYIQRKRQEIVSARETERELLEKRYIDPEQEANNVMSFDGALFDRSPNDSDFLMLRIGTGTQKASRKISYKEKEEISVSDPMVEFPKRLHEEFSEIDNVPIIINLQSSNAIGVVGEENALYEFAKQTLVDICTRQYHEEVKLFLVSEEDISTFEWARWFPHFNNAELNVRNIASTTDERTNLLEYLYSELLRRHQEKQKLPHFVIFVFNCPTFKNHPVSKFLNSAAELGASFLFFENYKEYIPQHCSQIITLESRVGEAIINSANGKGASQYFTFRSISDEAARAIALKLAPVYCEEISLEGTLTKNISFFNMLGIFTVDDINLKQNWASAKIYNTMAAPIGVKTQNEIVFLDLHEKAHGPHGLVAGTTGSGKSEALQTYILSMAITYHPYEVGFVIIDFKGGGMANQFDGLPHSMGAITNIDGREIDRSLKSIKAELLKRQRMFKEADVNNIGNYIKKYKAGEVLVPLPHLIIVVDEFAELKAEQPEFMKELISAARIGRSLGVHLILATQKPSGQVNEQIWSNSRFKLCLKVQTPEDSNEVLKSPLAAEIKEPGRAYLQVGNNELFELFQSAYSGAPSVVTDFGSQKEYDISLVSMSGKRRVIYQQKKLKTQNDTSVSQLDAIVDYVGQYCKKADIPRLPSICLPSLRRVIDYSDSPSENSAHITVPIGEYDDPENQYQGVYTIDLTTQNLIIIGSTQTGKTNCLQAIIRGLSTNYSPDDVNIYIADFASMSLKNFESLNHVGGVVIKTEDEKLKNLFKLISSEIQTRREKMISVGVSSFSSYREAGYRDLPLIVLMIDNLTALRELYFSADDDELLSICREGLSVGISVVISNSQTSGIGYRYLSNFAGKIAFFCNDSNEYSSLFDHCRETVENIPGRCMVEIENRRLDCQAYQAYQGEREIDRSKSIAAYIEEMNEKFPQQKARIIPEIPEFLSAQYIYTNFMPIMQKNHSIIAGLNYADISPVVFDLASLGVLGLSGGDGSSSSNFLTNVIKMSQRVHPSSTRFYIIDAVSKPLAKLKGDDNVVRYEVVQDRCLTIFEEISAELERRYQNLANDVAEDYEQIVLIINSYDMMESLDSSQMVKDCIKAFTTKYKSLGICIIAADCPNASINYSSPEIMKKLRDNPNFVFFDDLSLVKFTDLPFATTREFKKKIEAGDGYYIKEEECLKFKMVLAN